MKKILAFLSIISIFLNMGFYKAVAGEVDFFLKTISLEKGSESGKESISLSSTDDSFVIEFAVGYLGSNYVKISSSFPSGLTSSGFEIVSDEVDRCYKVDSDIGITNSDINQTNSNFSYDFHGNGLGCEAIIRATYKTNSINTGIHNLSYTIVEYNDQAMNNPIFNTITDNVTINVTNNILVTEARILDSNNNGIIDGYRLNFNENFDNSLFDITNVNTKLTIGGITCNSLSCSLSGNAQTDNTLDVNFTESQNWNNGEKPVISLSTFTNSGTIFDNLVNLIGIDELNPIIFSINGNSNINSVNIDGTSNIELLVSEDLNSGLTSANLNLKDKNNLSITGVLSINGTGLILNPNNTLYSDKNPFTLVGITDWAGNITPSIQINIFDNVNPVGENIGLTNTGVRIDYGNIYTKNQTVNLALSGSDDTGITQMMIGNDSSFTSSSWLSYTGTYSWSLSAGTGTKTVYVKFRDAAGNTSPTYSDSIILDTSIPNVAFSHTEGTYNNSLTLSMTGSPVGTNIYYTLDGTTPNSSSGTLYTSGILIGTGISTYNFKIIGIYTDISGNINSEIYSRTYTFNCPTIANGVVTCTYPTYTFTCNSGYHKDGNSCVQDQSSSPGGSSGGGGGYTPPTCTTTQIECSLYKGKYIWKVKSGNSCTSSKIGTSCIPTTSTGTTNTGITNTGSISDNLNNGTGTTTGSGIDIIDTISTIKTDNGETIIFIDIYNSFAKNYIETIAKKSITKGYSDQTFRPNTNITRIEFLKMILRGLNIEYLSYTGKKNTFYDVPDDSWQSAIVIKALEVGIISKNKYFNPDKSISRVEAMKMLVSRAKINVGLNEFEKYSFVDISGTMARYVEKAYILGLINGQTTDKGTIFRPNDNISRAESAKIIVKIINFLQK